MKNILLECARYIMILLITWYTWQSFTYFRKKDEEQKRRVAFWQNICILGVHFLGYLTGYLSTGRDEMILLYSGQVVYFVCVIYLARVIYPDSSRMLVSYMCMLLNIGFIMLTRLSFPLAVKQFVIVCVGTLMVSVIPWIMKKFRALRRFAWLYGIIGIALLLVVLLTADTTYGAKLFLDLKYFSIQPSEFVKLIYVFFIAAMFEKSSNIKQVIITSLMAAVHVLILVASRDLGGALIFAVIYLMMLYAATKQPLYLFGGLLCGSAASFVAWKLFDHIQVRVTAWLNPWDVIDTKGYQIAQSLFAIGTGGYLGSGLYEGSPGQIPIVEQDFIFSAIAEEFGGIAAICVILICLGCLLLFLNTAIESKKPFYRYLAYGLAVAYGIQVFLTIGGALKFIPSTGVTLPLVSYGGSSMLSTLCMFSVVQGLYIESREDNTKTAHKKAVNRENAVSASKELYRVRYLFSGMFCLLCGFLCYFLTFQSKEIINNPYNLRQDNFSKKVIRGDILSEDGEILAQTLVTENGKEARFYPYGKMFSHVVGYTENGKSGIEQKYNFELLTSDIPIYEKLYHEFAGTKSQGNQVVTTFSAKLQKVAHEAMGEYRGAVVVMEPSTGKILAMVSKPDFNPNTINEDWEMLTAVDNTDSVLLNRATQGLYAPGSTFKLLTVLEYMREHPITWQNYAYECDGNFTYHNAEINCYHGKSHGMLNTTSAFARSCNGAFANIGTNLSITDFNDLCRTFLFNTALPYPLAYEKSTFLLQSDAPEWEILQTAIGQGQTTVSPLHNALITSAIANGGVLMKPYLITELQNAYGKTEKQYLPSVYQRLMTAEEARSLTELMTACVTEGTGYAVVSDMYTTAGKTGTAEWEDGKEAHAWFVGFAPAEKPKLVVSIVLEEAGTGSDYAAPVAKKIFDAYFEE